MKKQTKLWANVTLGAICLSATIGIGAQINAPVYESPVIKLGHGQGDQYDYVPNEVIVKFKDSSGVSIHSAPNGMFRTSSVRKVDNKLTEIGVVESTQLMPLTGDKKIRKGAPAKSIYSKPIEEPDMSQLYLFKINPDKQISVEKVVEKLNALDEVEYAHPNYRVYALVEQALEPGLNHNHEHNDPLKGEQYAHDAINLPELWAAPIINEERPVIAIIDTGVDIEHPDLAANIWTNPRESEGSESEDDDSNGFVDDLHGWDFYDKTPIMSDPNGHGTHCAGIAAAVGNNGIGITGANPDALIMPIRVMDSEGSGPISVIIQGIDYAVANNADVISMSLGTSTDIPSLYDALQKAYQNSILVAAAGNNGQSIYRTDGLHFPAAYDIVLGVQASNKQNKLASFTNYDPDGSFYVNTDRCSEWYNYEIIAPGDIIMSTFPGGKYKHLNGTSMATPLVAGAISRLLQTKPAELYRDTWISDITHAIDEESGIFDAYKAFTFNQDTRKSALSLLSIEIDDTQFGDGDGNLDAGETVELYPSLRSEWGHASNIKLSIKVDGRYESASSIEVIETDVDFGYSLNSRGIGKSTNPLRIKIKSDLEDGHNLKLIVRATCDNIYEEMSEMVDFTIRNAHELKGILEADLTLDPSIHYVISGNLGIPQGVQLTIPPGTSIEVVSKAKISNEGTLFAVGTPDSPIIFNAISISGVYNNPERTYFEYCHFREGTFRNCLFKNCLFKNSNYSFDLCDIQKTNITESTGSTNSTRNVNNCNIIANHSNFLGSTYVVGVGSNPKDITHCSNNIFNNTKNFYYNTTDVKILKFPNPNYWGTSKEDIARIGIYDANHKDGSVGFGRVDLSNMLTRPVAEAHGVVWKVIVNGYDAQDEYELLLPLGVGKHKFEVYFNRQMNKNKVPTIAMGAQEPYNQIPIEEEGGWNEEGTIYTAYLTIDGKSNCDGVNRIYVAEAEDDEFFPIPIENGRFNVNVQSAGSLSTGLMAEAGLGKVSLTWETDEEDFEDLLGYNIIRYTEHVDSIYEKDYNKYGDYKEHLVIKGDTITVNKTLIDSKDQAFTDFDVVPGTTYYYQIKQLTTSFNSYNLSNPVAATPLTAAKGDANGSMSVDVADVVTEVAYMTNQNPQPFIFEAADVNADLAVNVLDVVGTVNIIRNPKGASAMSINSTVTYTIEDGILYVDSDVALGGVQFRIEAGEDFDIKALEALGAFEVVKDYTAENGWLLLAYSMSGKTLPVGKHALFSIGDAEITEAVFSDAMGRNVMAICGNTTGIGAIEAMQMQMPYPNPFSDVLNIPYVIGQEGSHSVRISISTPAGIVVASHKAQCDFGYYNYTWRPAASLDGGIYFVTLHVDDRLMQTARVILRR